MLELYEHNAKAYENAVALLAKTGKAAVIHPTGTGKSFIGFQLALDNPDKIICWLSPSDYIFRTQLENLSKAADGANPSNIRFFTYAKLMLMNDSELDDIAPDYIILDEFHRCGAEFWGKGVQKLLQTYPSASVLGLSATHIRYLDNRRDMADELFDGHVASQMTLGEAVVRGILAPPTYVTTVYSYENDVARYEARIRSASNKRLRDSALEQLEELRRALEKADGLDKVFRKYMTDSSGKYLVFCANKEHMDEMVSHVPEWFGAVDEHPNIYRAYSSDPGASGEFDAFKSDESEHLKLLFCIDMLNEGVHVENISGVILFRPTVSPIVFKQQIGRAMSAGCRKNAVILDIVDNISNLYSIDAVCEEMQNAVDFYRYYGENEKIVNERFTVIDEVYDCRRLFDELEEMLSVSWDRMYEEAKAYYEENGDLLPDASYITPLGYPLGQWIITQRQVYRGNRGETLSEERIEKLNAVGMSWQTKNERFWSESYRLAKEYYEKHGNLDVSRDDRPLYQWILRQRAKYRDGSLPEEEYEALSAIGMVWEIENSWEVNFPEAQAFYEKNGHLDIPAGFVTDNGIKLGNWYRTVKNQYREKLLSDERQKQLEEIGMQWTSVKDRTWTQYYELAKAYYAEHGDLAVPAKYVAADGKNLGTWIATQRAAKAKKKGALSDEQEKLLDEIGMSWQVPADKWNAGYEYAAAYYADHGSCDVPAEYVNADGFRLGVWLSSQRNKYRNGKLKPMQIKKLNALHVSWNPSDAAWEKAFAEAKRYYNTHKTVNVPGDCVTDSGFRLGSWIANQRTSYRQKKLNDTQIALLKDCGIRWNASEEKWRAGYACAQEYYRENGDLDVPQNFQTSDSYKLGSWLSAKRAAYKKDLLEPEKVKMLEKIGMVWDVNEARWEQAYQAAGRYLHEHGNVENIPASVIIDGVPVYEWLRGQKRQYDRGLLRADRKAKLEKFGLFETRDEVKKRELAVSYERENEHFKADRAVTFNG